MKKTFLGIAFVTAVIIPSLSAQVLQHEVMDGETLYGIARRYGLTMERLSSSNELQTPDLLLPGTILTIPNRYTVERGDTLYSIARRFQTSVATLTAANNLTSETIRPEQVLLLPADAVVERVRVAATDVAEEATTEATVKREGETTPVETLSPAEEGAAIAVAAEVSRPLDYTQGGVWPVAGSRRMLDGKFPGVMIRAERGSPVYAISSGRVVYAGPHTTFGNVVFIQTNQGYIYVYGGQEAIAVDVGELIAAGTPIGTVGLSPSEGAAALYFSVWQNDRFVDPETAPRG